MKGRNILLRKIDRLMYYLLRVVANSEVDSIYLSDQLLGVKHK